MYTFVRGTGRASEILTPRVLHRPILTRFSNWKRLVQVFRIVRHLALSLDISYANSCKYKKKNKKYNTWIYFEEVVIFFSDLS